MRDREPFFGIRFVGMNFAALQNIRCGGRMDPDKITESAQLARKLYQAVLSLDPADLQARRQVHKMAKALALAELMAARAHRPNAI